MWPFWIIGVFVLLTGITVLYEFSLLLGLITFFAGVVIIVGYIMMAPKFPVQAIIFQKRHGSVRMVFDRATRLREDKDEDTFKYMFKKLKDTTKAALYDNLYPSGRGEIAFFYSPAPGEYYPATVREDVKEKHVTYKDNEGTIHSETVKESEINPIPDDLLGWMVLKQKRMKQKYMQISLWDKYYPLMVMAVLMVCIMLIISALFNGLGPIADSFREASRTQAEATSRLAAVMEKWLEHEEGVQTATPAVKTPEQPAPPPDVGG